MQNQRNMFEFYHMVHGKDDLIYLIPRFSWKTFTFSFLAFKIITRLKLNISNPNLHYIKYDARNTCNCDKHIIIT